MRISISMLLLALGCSTSQLESSVEPEIVVTVTADRASVAEGQSLQITVAAVNRASTERTLEFSSGCLTTFEFLDSSGRVVGEAQQMCVQVVTRKTLKPGESLSESHAWARGGLDLPRLAAGSYALRGVLLTSSAPIRSTSLQVNLP